MRINESNDAFAALEKMVDAYTLSDVLEALARICIEKSEHIIITYDDKATAKAWDRAHKPIMAASAHPSITRVSA